jgi:hypothetical protein
MTTTAPRWINLDELVSQDLRAEMAAFTERVSTYGFSLEDELEAESLDRRWHDEIHAREGVSDDFFALVMAWTGYDQFDEARIASDTHPATVAVGTPTT